MTPRFISLITPSSNFDYPGGSTNNNGNNSSSKNDISAGTDDHTEERCSFPNSQENTCARVSFLITLQAPGIITPFFTEHL